MQSHTPRVTSKALSVSVSVAQWLARSAVTVGVASRVGSKLQFLPRVSYPWCDRPYLPIVHYPRWLTCAATGTDTFDLFTARILWFLSAGNNKDKIVHNITYCCYLWFVFAVYIAFREFIPCTWTIFLQVPWSDCLMHVSMISICLAHCLYHQHIMGTINKIEPICSC